MQLPSWSFGFVVSCVSLFGSLFSYVATVGRRIPRTGRCSGWSVACYRLKNSRWMFKKIMIKHLVFFVLISCFLFVLFFLHGSFVLRQSLAFYYCVFFLALVYLLYLTSFFCLLAACCFTAEEGCFSFVVFVVSFNRGIL